MYYSTDTRKYTCCIPSIALVQGLVYNYSLFALRIPPHYFTMCQNLTMLLLHLTPPVYYTIMSLITIMNINYKMNIQLLYSERSFKYYVHLYIIMYNKSNSIIQMQP